jgi:hypothetical protein
MLRSHLVAAVGLGLAGLGVSAANAQTLIYQNNFEAGWLDYRWYANSRLMQDAPIFTTFNGWHSNTATEVHVAQPSMTSLQPGEMLEYTATFDLYIFDSWDGYWATGADRILVEVNGVQRFNESFSNDPNKPQSFRAPDMPRANYGGRTAAADAIYRNVALTFKVPADADKVRMRFMDGGIGTYTDESWGIDNFRLSYSVVPAPGAVGLALAGGMLMLPRRRRGA